MIRRFSLSFLLLVFAGTSRALPSEQVSAPPPVNPADSAYDAASFAEELHRIAAIIGKKPKTQEIEALRDALTPHWAVSTPDGTFSISTEPLRNQLTPSSLDKAEVWVIHLAEEAESSTKFGQSFPQARVELDRILARPEFAAVRPPTAWELFRQRLAAWLERLLGRLFGGIARHPIGGEILFWLIIIVAVGAIAAWVFRFLASRDRRPSLPQSQSVVAVRTWQEWIRAAREAANAGNYREAVHSAYWAGIVRLEDAGVIPKDRAKTPREYLRLVTEPAPGQLAASPTHRDQLTALTRKLELTWYANRGASPEDFKESLRQLEALGCSLE
jgi:hypothetical protein